MQQNNTQKNEPIQRSRNNLRRISCATAALAAAVSTLGTGCGATVGEELVCNEQGNCTPISSELDADDADQHKGDSINGLTDPHTGLAFSFSAAADLPQGLDLEDVQIKDLDDSVDLSKPLQRPVTWQQMLSPGARRKIALNDTAPATCGEDKFPTEFVWPAKKSKTVCQPFGKTISYQGCGFHTGMDICGPSGDELVAVANGKVVHVGPMWYDAPTLGRGPYAVIIQHGPGFYSTYGHNSKTIVKVGDCVKVGQKIGEMGSLGYSSGPHVHFEMLQGTPYTGYWQAPFKNTCKFYIDPADYISK